MSAYSLSLRQVEALRALPIDEKKAACVYESFRFALANGYVERRTYKGFYTKVYTALRKTHTSPAQCWLELSKSQQSSYIQLVNLPQVSAAEILPQETKEHLEAAAQRLTIIDNGPPPDEAIIAIRIDWGMGMHAIMSELRRQVERLAPFYVRGAHGNKDIAHMRGKRTKAGELDPIFGWIAVAADLATTGGNKSETARRMQVERKTVRDSEKRLSKKLLEWFEVSPPK